MAFQGGGLFQIRRRACPVPSGLFGGRPITKSVSISRIQPDGFVEVRNGVGIVARTQVRVPTGVPGVGNVGLETECLAQFGDRLRELARRGEVAAALLMCFGT